MSAQEHHLEINLTRIADHRRNAAIEALRHLLPGMRSWTTQPAEDCRPGRPCRLSAIGALPDNASLDDIARALHRTVVEANGRTVPVIVRCARLDQSETATFHFGPRGALRVECRERR